MRILLFPMRPISILYYTDIAFHLAIPVIMEILSSEGRIEEYRIRIDFVVVISVSVVFSKNLPAII
jgi:hypothetical protein